MLVAESAKEQDQVWRLPLWQGYRDEINGKVADLKNIGNGPYGGAITCVEINQCIGCTRQFFTKSFLGDGAAVLDRSSGEEPASPRHRAGVASMAWRTTR